MPQPLHSDTLTLVERSQAQALETQQPQASGTGRKDTLRPERPKRTQQPEQNSRPLDTLENSQLPQQLAPRTTTETDHSDSAALAAKNIDWSTAYPFPVYGTADSLRMLPGSRPVIYREVGPQGIFGTESVLVPSSFRASSAPASLTDNPVFQGFVLLLAAIYAVLLFRNLGDVRQLLGRISRKASSAGRLGEEPGNGGFLRFLNIATTIGMLFMGVIIVKYGDRLVPPALLRMLPSGAVLAVSLLATAACTAVLFYQRFALRIAGVVTRSQTLVSQMLLLKRTCFSLAVIIALPALLLYALCPRGTGEVLFYVIAAELAFTLLLYLKESLNLFLSKKISILHWFLYLCIVEIFPVSLLCLLATR